MKCFGRRILNPHWKIGANSPNILLIKKILDSVINTGSEVFVLLRIPERTIEGGFQSIILLYTKGTTTTNSITTTLFRYASS